MAVVFTLIAFKSIMLLLVLHSYITYGRTIISKMEGRDECPMPCLCYNQTVVCSAMNLKKVPINFPSRTRVLYLNDNAIEKLDIRLLSRLEELEELHLRGNKLSGIDEKDIEFLPVLKHVDLRDNPLVCGCPLANVVRRTLDGTMPLDVILGDTRCVIPMQDKNRRASDVLKTLDCRHRTRRGEGRCHPRFCLNGGTCNDGEHGPYCVCPDSYVGDYCERTNSDSVTIFLDDITSRSVKVSWRSSYHVAIGRYFVTFKELHPTAEQKYFWTQETYYIFGRLMPGAFYEVCVTGYTTNEERLDECCEDFSTMPHPSHPKTNYPDPPHPHQPTTQSRDTQDVIHKAAVILGSIIGVCAFFIICLTLVYKFRTLSRPRNWGRRRSSSSPPIDEEAEEAETELSQDPDNENNGGGGPDLFALSAPPEHPTAPSEDEADTAELDADPPLSISDRIPMNRVLQAMHPPSSRVQLDATSPNTVVLYRPENRSAGEDLTALSRDNPSGTTPIFLVADGNHYPLDPALSHVLRSAMSRSNPRDPLPNEPPPPYSEIAEDAHPTPASSIASRVEPDSQSNDQCEPEFDASSVEASEQDK